MREGADVSEGEGETKAKEPTGTGRKAPSNIASPTKEEKPGEEKGVVEKRRTHRGRGYEGQVGPILDRNNSNRKHKKKTVRGRVGGGSLHQGRVTGSTS